MIIYILKVGIMITDREIIRMIARRDGDHHRPSYYKEAAKEFGREVSSSSITKSIGNWKTRTRKDPKPLLDKASRLYVLCDFDAGYLRHIVERAILA